MVVDKLAVHSHITGGQSLWFTHSKFIADLVVRDSIPRKIRNRWLNTLELSNSLNLKVSHIYREGNMVVDKLAVHSHVTGGQSLWFTHSEFIADLVVRDYSLLPFYRLR